MPACPGCRLDLPADPGAPTHGYFNVSGECWSVFGEVTAFRSAHPVVAARTSQLVDVYAVQHAGGSHPDKSVDIHLVGLHLSLVERVSSAEMPMRLKRLADSVVDWPHLPPPRHRGETTIADVALAGEARHVEAMRRWAESVWRAWSDHHAAVADLRARIP